MLQHVLTLVSRVYANVTEMLSVAPLQGLFAEVVTLPDLLMQ